MRTPRLPSLAAALILSAGALTSGAHAQVSTAITYQGQLKKSGQVVNSNSDFRFTLFDAEFGGNVIGGPIEKLGIAVSDGLFTASVDFGKDAYVGGKDFWMLVEVRNPTGSGSYTPMGARQKLTAAPSSLSTRGLRVDTNGNVKISGEDHTFQQAVLQLDAGKDAVQQYAGIGFFDRGNLKWGMGKLPEGDFYLDNIGGASPSRFSIRHDNGNVGIGTETPFWKLTLATQTNDLGFTHIDKEFDTVVGSFVGLGTGYLGTWSDHPLKLISHGDPYNDTKGLTLRQNGYVGIGTEDPLTKLHVQGDILTSGSITLGYNLQSTLWFTRSGIIQTGEQPGDGLQINPTSPSGTGRVTIGGNGTGAQVHIVSSLGVGTAPTANKIQVGGGAFCNGTQWVDVCDKNAKENFADIDPEEILAKVADLPVSTWHYKGNDKVHIGPTAQDFFAAFGYGENDTSLAAVNTGGVSLAAIKGLNSKLAAKDGEIAELRARLEKLEALVAAQTVNAK